MTAASTLEQARRFYADEIAAVAHVETPGLADAYARVPREAFLGPGPWQIAIPDASHTAATYRPTPDADPRHLYHNVVIAIDATRQLNNGQPAALAMWLDSLALRPGDVAVHVGCGVGYYTAIVAEVVGPTGAVLGIELDPDLAARAAANLAPWPRVRVVAGDGATCDPGPFDACWVNAGATHLMPTWLDGMKPGARFAAPLTIGMGDSGLGRGMVVRVERTAAGHAARFTSPVGIYSCAGARDPGAEAALRALFGLGGWTKLRSIRRDPHPVGEACLVHRDGACLSSLEPGA
jgi:protein-L-isoaspartate(D-aspartate) O-methyltransferase